MENVNKCKQKKKLKFFYYINLKVFVCKNCKIKIKKIVESEKNPYLYVCMCRGKYWKNIKQYEIFLIFTYIKLSFICKKK